MHFVPFHIPSNIYFIYFNYLCEYLIPLLKIEICDRFNVQKKFSTSVFEFKYNIHNLVIIFTKLNNKYLIDKSSFVMMFANYFLILMFAFGDKRYKFNNAEIMGQKCSFDSKM